MIVRKFANTDLQKFKYHCDKENFCSRVLAVLNKSITFARYFVSNMEK